MDLEARSKYLLGTDGIVTVKEAGIYYLYSQVGAIPLLGTEGPT